MNTAATPTRTTSEASGAIVPAEHVFLAENHDYAYYLWRERGVRDRILVHIDAHHDLWWITEKGSVNIANFLCQALRENQVRELVWIVPDPTWESRKSRRPLLDHLRELARQYPGAKQPVEVTKDAISTVVLGKPLRICPLASLPRFAEDVLLDIDIDFFVIPRASFRDWDTHARLPWCWPEDLLARLVAAGVRADLATIVYSVDGGYTPLKWKYLGDEMALRLRRLSNEETIRGVGLMREAALAVHHGERAAAEQIYQQAAQLLPASAAPPFHLAWLCVEAGRLNEARSFYRKALLLDPSYQTAYNSGGLWRIWDRRFRQAKQELRRTLDLDPGDAYAHYGLGRLAAAKKRWREAEVCFRKALQTDPHCIDALRWLAHALDKQGRGEEAIEAYVRSLRLVLAGHKPLGAPIVTLAGKAYLPDPAHWDVHGRLARLYERKGLDKEAINGYRMAIAGGYDSSVLHARLARLYLKKGEWSKGAEQAWQGAGRMPRDGWRAARRLHYRAKRSLQEKLGAFSERHQAN